MSDAYRRQSEAVRQRFARIAARPVVLEGRNLGIAFSSGGVQTRVLAGLDFQIRRREFVTVIGPSGCGKSTLARLIAGLETASMGEIRVDGQQVTRTGPDRGMVFQHYSLFPWLTVTKNVMFGLEAQGLGRFEAERQAHQWVNLVGLAPYAQYYPHQLSGGMKQRVAIARALAAQPKVLLMDEPFGALDAQTRAKMQSYLMEIWKKIDVTIVFITHDLDEAVYLSDRIVVLKARPGEIVEIIENPVPQPRSPLQFQSAEFQAVKQRLEALIHPPVLETETLEIPKLTMAGDDVL